MSSLNFILLSYRMTGHELWHTCLSLDIQILKFFAKDQKTLFKDIPLQCL